MNYFELIFLKPAKFYARRWGEDWQDVYHDLILAYYVLKERGKITDKDGGQVVRKCVNYLIDKYRTAKCVLVRKDVRVVSIEEISEERLYFEYDHEDFMKMLQQLKNKLTKREAEVLDLMLEGKKLSEIAKMLGVSKPRITTIKHHIMEKLKIYFKG